MSHALLGPLSGSASRRVPVMDVPAAIRAPSEHTLAPTNSEGARSDVSVSVSPLEVLAPRREQAGSEPEPICSLDLSDLIRFRLWQAAEFQIHQFPSLHPAAIASLATGSSPAGSATHSPVPTVSVTTTTMTALLPTQPVGVAERMVEQLCDAAHHGDLSMVDTLLENGAQPNTASRDGFVPLALAAGRGRLGVVTALLNSGALPNLTVGVDGSSALMWAASGNQPNMVRLLLDRGADPCHTGNDGWSALMVGSQEGHFEVVRRLLDEDVDPSQCKDDDGATALMLAAQNGHAAVTTLLLKRGANPNQANFIDGGTALTAAVSSDHIDVVRILLDRGAWPNQRRTDNGGTALMAAVYRGDIDIVDSLLEASANPNLGYSTDGSSALMLSAQEGYAEISRLLLMRGAEPSQAKTDTGSTALMWATLYRRETIAQLLCAFGANQYARCHYNGDVHTARSIAFKRLVPVLNGWYDEIKNWSPFRIGVGCRFAEELSHALNLGRVDPADVESSSVLLDTALSSSLWDGMLAPDPATTKLVRDAVLRWSPSRHRLYHAGFREAVHTLLLIALRIRSCSRVGKRVVGAGAAPPGLPPLLPRLPAELWLGVLRYCDRKDFPVTPRFYPAPVPARTYPA